MLARLPLNEEQRLAKLAEYEILDTPAEKLFDDIVKLASIICGTPVGLATFVDKERQWYKAQVGVPAEMTGTPRDMAFCSHTILETQPLIVPNLTEDSRFSDNPLVTGDTAVRFYAGVPLTTPDGFNLGALCVIDLVERKLTTEQVEALKHLAQQLINQLELRRFALKAGKENKETNRKLNDLLTSLDDCVWSFPLAKNSTESVYVSPSAEKVFGYPLDFCSVPGNIYKIVHPDDLDLFKAWISALTEENQYLEYRIIQSNSDVIWIESKGRIYSENGIPLRIEGISMNITGKIEAQDLIKKQTETLEMSAKLAALGEMSASISHEIKNPLSLVANCAGYLVSLADEVKTVDAQEVRETAQTIEPS
jgi:PAS domain S-box-containing protein